MTCGQHSWSLIPLPFNKIQRGFQGITANLQICPRFTRNHSGIIILEYKREMLIVLGNIETVPRINIFLSPYFVFFNSSDYHFANKTITFITKYDIIYIIIRKGRHLPILLIYINLYKKPMTAREPSSTT